nr:hypothetical protein [Micromonospora sp. DSM 115978]
VDASTAAAGGASWPAVLSIRWQVSWTASTGETGVLEETTTDTAVPVTVEEVQAVERARRPASGAGAGVGGVSR